MMCRCKRTWRSSNTIRRFNGFALLSNMNHHRVENMGLPASEHLRIGAGEAHAPGMLFMTTLLIEYSINFVLDVTRPNFLHCRQRQCSSQARRGRPGRADWAAAAVDGGRCRYVGRFRPPSRKPRSCCGPARRGAALPQPTPPAR